MRNFILGTDWWTDCDDVVALRILSRAHKSGEICLKGVAINACMEYSVSSVDGLLTTEGVSDVPIGIDFEADEDIGNALYQKNLSAYASRYLKNEDAENAVKLYRQILAEADEPVEIVEVGFLQVVSALLESEPDEISDKSGLELVKEKVSKFWVMAGKWSEEGGKEYNFSGTGYAKKASEIFCRLCPVPITFLGFEVGERVISGSKLDKDDVLYTALCDHGSPNGRESWDPMTAVLALTGDEEVAGYDTVTGFARVDEADGRNYFTKSPDGNHKYVVMKKEPDFYKNIIDDKIKSM